jgi:hypothetical protein
MSADTRPDEGHPCLWWQGGTVPDEDPGVRAQYDAMLAAGPRARAARERNGGAR